MAETTKKSTSSSATKGAESKEQVFTPKVNVSSRGKVSATLEGIADEYRRLYPDMDCRWVFHSARRPELSNVISRMAEGYERIEPSEFKGYPIEPFVDERGDIRVADVVLMKIPAGQRSVNQQERQRLADAQIQRVKDQFEQSMEQVRSGDHRAMARGAVSVEEREHNLNYEQPDSKE